MLIFILIVAVGVWFFYNYSKGKARRLHSDIAMSKRAVAQGSRRKPSWFETVAQYNFYHELNKHCAEMGIPHFYVDGVMKEPEARDALMAYIAEVEVRGRSVPEQVVLATDFLRESWRHHRDIHGEHAQQTRVTRPAPSR